MVVVKNSYVGLWFIYSFHFYKLEIIEQFGKKVQEVYIFFKKNSIISEISSEIVFKTVLCKEACGKMFCSSPFSQIPDFLQIQSKYFCTYVKRVASFGSHLYPERIMPTSRGLFESVL